jgi:hypothetical protein
LEFFDRDRDQKISLLDTKWTGRARSGRKYRGEALTFREIATLASARLLENATDFSEMLLLPSGAVGTFVEWGALLWLAGTRRDGKQILTKDAMIRFYTDPRFFQDVQPRLEALREQRAVLVSQAAR